MEARPAKVHATVHALLPLALHPFGRTSVSIRTLEVELPDSNRLPHKQSTREELVRAERGICKAWRFWRVEPHVVLLLPNTILHRTKQAAWSLCL